MENIILFADSNRGIYIPQHFAESINREHVSGVDKEEWDILMRGPDNELYFDVWNDVLNNAAITKDGREYTLHQDGDLFLIDYDNLTIEEEIDLFGESERFDNDMDYLRGNWPDVRQMVVEQYGGDDIPALNEAFNDWVDMLNEDGIVSDYACQNVSREEVE